MMGSPRRRYIVTVTLLYGVLGASWILLSDRLLVLFVDSARLTDFAVGKGLAFVALTALLLAFVLQAVPPDDERGGGSAVGPGVAWWRVLAAQAFPALAFALQWVFWEQISPFAWLLFFPAAFFGSWVGGLAGGVTASVLSTGIVWYVFIPPRFSFDLADPTSIMSIGVFLVMGLLFTFTHHRLRQAERRAADTKFHALVDQSLAGIYIIQDDRFRYVNPAFAQIFGYGSPAAVIDRLPVAALVAQESRDLVAEAVRQRISGEATAARYEFVGCRADGGHVSVEVHGRRFLFDGRPAIIGVVLDISERVALEQALRRGEELMRAVIDGSTDAIFVKDLDGRYLLANAAAAEFIGKPVAAVIGHDDCDLFPPDTAAMLRALDRGIMADGQTRTCEEDLNTLDGQHLTFLVTKGPVCDDAGQVIGLFGISRDITARSQVEAALRRQEEELRLRNEELERFNRATVGRELEMIALKRQVNALCGELGRPAPFLLASIDEAVAEDLPP